MGEAVCMLSAPGSLHTVAKFVQNIFHPQQPYYIVCIAANGCVLSKTADFRMYMFISAA